MESVSTNTNVPFHISYGRTVLLVCFIVMIPVAIIAGNPALYFLAAFLVMIPVSSTLSGKIFLRSLKVDCQNPLPIMAGLEIHVPVVIHNSGRHPVFDIEPQILLPNHRLLSDASVSIAGHSSVSCVVTGIMKRRGVYQLSTMQLQYAGPLGLGSPRREFPTDVEIIVLPRSLGVSITSLSGGLQIGAEQTSRNRGAVEGGEFYSIRPYRSGDAWRRVHWKTTARTGELMVVEREATSSLALIVMIDLRWAETEENSPFEILIRLTAQIVEDCVCSQCLINLWALLPGGEAVVMGDQLHDRLEALIALARVDPQMEAIKHHASLETIIRQASQRSATLLLLTNRLDVESANAVNIAARAQMTTNVVMMQQSEPPMYAEAAIGKQTTLWQLIALPDGKEFYVEQMGRR